MDVSPDYTTLLPWGDLIARGAALHPERDAFVFPEARRTYAVSIERVEQKPVTEKTADRSIG